MDKKDIKKIAKNPAFIPGIYNYCDYWCERCPFTSRCMNFALSGKQFPDKESHDINNKLFWQQLSEILQLTLEMLEESAIEKGIDLNSIEFESVTKEEKTKKKNTEEEKCCLSAKKYADLVENWFKSSSHLFKRKEDELNLAAELETLNINPAKEAAEIKDAVDIIRWYQHQIHSKLTRAAIGDSNEFPEDRNGSAKVALIAIDRSMVAWREIHQHFPECEDETLDFLVHLDRLRRKVEKIFPKAREFVRPGFDENY
jgi:hypothetical protein